ncbi:hypothetical protein [Streptomyces sp. ATCC 21386]|uniref:hypothetical protein n=1 Tax=Streptomyces sp. ATCC 21386 TaxID=2699428 RepID=UPI001BFF6874|nr:hypothetical protein [Streptomyces sp. ATCC 21386]
MTIPPWSERLDHEESLVRGELAALREKATVLEERLARLVITRETLASLTGDGLGSVTGGPLRAAQDPPVVPAPAPGAGAVGGEPPPAPGPLDLEVARERILVLLAGAHQALKVQDIGEAIGEHPERVETTRSRLKKLAKEGLVSEVSPAWFAITPAARDHAGEGGEVSGTA